MSLSTVSAKSVIEGLYLRPHIQSGPQSATWTSNHLQAGQTQRILGLFWMETVLLCSISETAAHFTAFTNSMFRVKVVRTSKLFGVYSYLFPCCVSVCGESLSSLRCSSAMQHQLSEMIITQTAPKLPLQLSAGGWLCPVHRRALAGLPQWPKLTYITEAPRTRLEPFT